MKNEELRRLLVQELGIEHIHQAAQNEIIEKIGDVILKSLTATILQTLSPEAREEFEHLGALKDPARIQRFLETHAPNMQELLAEEMQKTIAGFKAREQK